MQTTLPVPLDVATTLTGAPRTFTLSNALVALDPTPRADPEAIRALRTHIMARHLEIGRRALAICAPTPGVGCTMVAANLAVALSQIGVKTLLVDANLRTPSIDKLFQPSGPVTGLQQCLSGDEPFSEFIEPEVLPDLSIMFAGGFSANPQELLASGRFADLMNFCLRDFEMTILDTPPANRCSDVHRISMVAGYGLVVARRNLTYIHDLKTLVSQLESDHAKVIGTVMTEN